MAEEEFDHMAEYRHGDTSPVVYVFSDDDTAVTAVRICATLQTALVLAERQLSSEQLTAASPWEQIENGVWKRLMSNDRYQWIERMSLEGAEEEARQRELEEEAYIHQLRGED